MPLPWFLVFFWPFWHFFLLLEASLRTLPSSSRSISSVCSLHPNLPVFEKHPSRTELGANPILDLILTLITSTMTLLPHRVKF